MYIVTGEPRSAGCFCNRSGLSQEFGEFGEDDVVRVGSKRFNVLEPPRTSASVMVCFNDVDRKVSVRSNHPELMCQNSPHLAISVMKWFDVLEPP